MFKKDTIQFFSNRLYLEINVDLPTGAKLADFQPSIFFFAGIVPNEFIIDQAQREP
jgi:hypothetical protein